MSNTYVWPSDRKAGYPALYYNSARSSDKPYNEIRSIVTRPDHPRTGARNIYYLFHDDRQFIFPMGYYGMKGLVRFVKESKVEGPLYVRVTHHGAKTYGFTPNDTGKVNGTLKMLRYDAEDRAIELEVSGAMEFLRDVGWPSTYLTRDQINSPECVACPNRRQLCVDREPRGRYHYHGVDQFYERKYGRHRHLKLFALVDKVVTQAQWDPMRGEYIYASDQPKPFHEHVATELAPICRNQTVFNTLIRFRFNRTRFMQAAETHVKDRFRLSSLAENVKTDFCETCIGCRHRGTFAYDRPQVADRCYVDHDEAVQNVLKRIEAEYGSLDRFKRMMWAMCWTWRIAGSQAEYRVGGFKSDGSYRLIRTSWAGRYGVEWVRSTDMRRCVSARPDKTRYALYDDERVRSVRFNPDHVEPVTISDDLLAAFYLLMRPKDVRRIPLPGGYIYFQGFQLTDVVIERGVVREFNLRGGDSKFRGATALKSWHDALKTIPRLRDLYNDLMEETYRHDQASDRQAA